LDADFLGRGPGRVRYAHDFAAGRAVENGGADMNRLYAVECTPTLTGAMADGRVVVRPSQVELVARALARGLGIDAKLPEGHLPWEAWIEAVVRDLKRHRGAGLVVAGEQQPPVVHALALAINDALGCVGKTVFAIEPVEARPASHVESIKELGSAMQAGQVQVLVMLGGNPGLYCARRCAVCRSAEEGGPGHPRSRGGRRDVASVPLAHSGSALSGDVGRHPFLRWHGVYPAAFDRTAVQW
jgi:hypothetical protein